MQRVFFFNFKSIENKKKTNFFTPHRIIEDKKKRRKNFQFSSSSLYVSLLLFYHRSLLFCRSSRNRKKKEISFVDLESVCFAFCGDVAEFNVLQFGFEAPSRSDNFLFKSDEEKKDKKKRFIRSTFEMTTRVDWDFLKKKLVEMNRKKCVFFSSSSI